MDNHWLARKIELERDANDQAVLRPGTVWREETNSRLSDCRLYRFRVQVDEGTGGTTPTVTLQGLGPAGTWVNIQTGLDSTDVISIDDPWEALRFQWVDGGSPSTGGVAYIWAFPLFNGVG